MGIPYSKQINAAFDQVTPLVAEGFEVLQTTRNVTFVLAEIQILTVVLLAFVLIGIFMLLITSNPDLERERQALVTPAIRWICSWAMTSNGTRRYGMLFLSVGVLLSGLVYAHYWYYFKGIETKEAAPEEPVPAQEGKDIDAIRTGSVAQ